MDASLRGRQSHAMRITFLLPHIELTGGIRVALEYANHLSALGHDLTLVYPRVPLYLQGPDKTTRGVRRWWRLFKLEMRHWRSRVRDGSPVSWFQLEPPVLRVPDLRPNNVPEGDIVVAVNWKTAEFMRTYPGSHGQKFYLIQGYETWYGPQHRVDATWTMPAHKVVVSSWLKELAHTRFGQDVYGPVLNGVNLGQFHNPYKVYHEPRRVGMLYHSHPIKGVTDGLRAFRIARAKYPDIRLVMFGTSQPHFALPKGVEFHHNPPQNKLRDIYGKCDIWLSPSRLEGCGLTPMEAMACRCAVVATNVGAVPDYAIPDVTALVSPPESPAALADNLIRLLDNDLLLKDVSEAGYQKIREFTWERAAKELESLFLRSVALT